MADELGQRGEVRRAGSVEAAAEIVPEANFELGACFHQAEEGIAGVAAGCRPGSAGDLAPRDLAADVVLGVVGVQGLPFSQTNKVGVGKTTTTAL